MLTTCGSSSRWVIRRMRPTGVIRGSASEVHSPGAGSVRRWCHRAELEQGERAAALAHPRLAVEERAPVADQVGQPHDGGDDQQHDEADQREGHVEEPLGPAVAGPVQLADVEEQRGPLELGDRQLAEPLLVEPAEGADPHAALVEEGGLGDDAVVVLGGAVEHEHGRGVLLPQGHQRGAVVHRRCGPVDGQAGHDRGRALRAGRGARAPERRPRPGGPPTRTRARASARRRPPAARRVQIRYQSGSTRAAPNTTKRGSSASPRNSSRTDTTAAAENAAPTDAPTAAARVRGTSGSPKP